MKGKLEPSSSTRVGTDVGPGTDAVECLTANDCAGKVLGVTECRLPACQSGKCTLASRPEGTKCDPLGGNPDQCKEHRCDAASTCDAVALADGTVCGFFKYGKQCQSGACLDDPDGSYDDGNPCTLDFCDNGVDTIE